jgi:glycosyltransferase involved in cell wall biosynthesis
MRVLVGLPTFNNGAFGYTIRRTLEALANQSYRDFRVLVVYKPSPGDRTLDVVDEFRDKLDVEVRIQGDGFVEEAMNEIFKAATDYGITLTTDDDAIPTKTWIQDHLQFHKNHEKIGITQGIVSSQIRNNENHTFSLFILRRFLGHLIGFYKPLIKELYGYRIIVNDMGLFACANCELGIEKHDYIYTLYISGVNMSFKSGRLIDGFVLPGYTRRGFGYESLLALHFIRQGLHSTIFNGGFVEHLERESLSRPKSKVSGFMIAIEYILFPYGVYYYGFKINMRRLKLYERLAKFYSKLSRAIIWRAYAIGLGLAIEAIENGYEPREVRRRLLEIEQEAKVKYGQGSRDYDH